MRVEGRIIGEPVFWPSTGENRGGNNYRGLAVRIALDDGGEALFFTESMGAAYMIGDLRAAKASGRFTSIGYVVNRLSDVQQDYYGLTLDVFPKTSWEQRVIVIHGVP